MADLYLSTGENVTGVSFGGRVFGSTGSESVNYVAGASGITVDQNVEQVRLPGSTSDYRFQQQGNSLLVFSGTTQVARVTLQSDADGTLLTFNNGTVEAKVSSQGLTLGGTTVSPTAPVQVVPAVIDGSGSGNGNQTFTLTEGTDTIQGNPGNLVGSNGTVNIAGDDLIIAGTSVAGGVASNNLGAGDVIDAGAGFDTLRIIDQVAGSVLAFDREIVPNLTNVERIEVQAIGNGSALNLVNANGVEEIFNVNSTADVLVTEINDDVVLGFENTDTDMTAVFDEDSISDGAVDVVVINAGEEATAVGATANNISGAVNLTVDTSDNAVDTVNVSATGAASRLNIADVTSDDDITTLNITGAAEDSDDTDGDVYVNAGAIAGSLTDVTSTTTGDVTLVIGGNTEDLTVTTGEGDDRLVLSAATFNGRDTVDLGEGDNTLELHFAGTATANAASVAAVNNASGVSTLALDAWTSSTESFQIDASKFNEVTDFEFNDTFSDAGGPGGGADFQSELGGSITVTNVRDENTFTIGTHLNNTASFSAATGADVLNLTLLGDADELVATDFDDVNVTLGANDARDDLFEDGENEVTEIGLVSVDDGATVALNGTASLLNVTIGAAAGATLDASNVTGTDGEITTDTATTGTGAEETEYTTYDASEANVLTGSEGRQTIIGTDSDDLISGETAATTEEGTTTINLNGLRLDGGQLQSVTVTIDGEDYFAAGQTAEQAAVNLAQVINASGDHDATAEAGRVIIADDDVVVNEIEATVNDAPVSSEPLGYSPEATGSTITVGLDAADASDLSEGATLVYRFASATTGEAVNVTYVVQADDIVPTPIFGSAAAARAATAENIADGLAGAIVAAGAAGNVLGAEGENFVVIANEGVVSIVPVAGSEPQTDLVITEVQDTANDGIATAANNVLVAPETYTFGTYTFANEGDELTVNVEGRTVTYTFDGANVTSDESGVIGGNVVTGDRIADDLRASAPGTFEGTNTDNGVLAVLAAAGDDTENATITFDGGDQTVPQNEAELVSLNTEVSGDTFTGGAGDDVFVIASRVTESDDGNTFLNGDVDAVTDFSGGDLLDLGLEVGGTEFNYSAGSGAVNFTNAVIQALSDFQADDDVLYSAQQVGSDTYIFTNGGDVDGDGFDDVGNAVVLLGVDVTTLAGDGSFIASNGFAIA